MPGIVTGGLAGLVATVPMSLTMVVMHRLLPPQERYALPPRLVAMRLFEKAHLPKPPEREERTALTIAAHFLYGTSVGAAYGLVGRSLPVPLAVGGLIGVLYGLGVWAVSYLGWLPALGILSPATKHPERRNLLMIVAHLVWGMTMGLLVHRWHPASYRKPQAWTNQTTGVEHEPQAQRLSADPLI
jgi:uncharacterized membrane protein YagU involved in acid resistance